MERTAKIKPARIFDTIADVGSLGMATLYVLYVALLLIFKLGTPWLNYCMLAITFIYIVFFVAKIAALNAILEKNKVQKRARFILRYSKWSMKLINAVFVILSIATTSQFYDADVIMMVGVFLVGFSFLISVMWDTVWFIVRRKLRFYKQGWDGLSTVEKNKRIEQIVGVFIESLDNFAGVKITESVTFVGRRDERRAPKSRRLSRRRLELSTSEDDL